MSILLIIGILLALLFNFVNGLNGAANSIATIVATRALHPPRAIALASLFNFLGPFLFTAAIARTLGEGILTPSGITPTLLLIAISAAAGLVILATFSGLPISSTHALVGGLIGAGIALQGADILILPGGDTLGSLGLAIAIGAGAGIILFLPIARTFQIPPIQSLYAGGVVGASLSITFLMISGTLYLSGISAILVFIIVSPILGFLAAFLFDVLISYLFRHSRQNIRRRIFRPLHVAGSAFQATSHGGHDGQHAIAIITALLIAEGVLGEFIVPLWVTAASAAAIGLGTLFGGWGVIERVAKKITRIRPYQGFSATISGGMVLSAVITAGIPVSTTHVINGTIVGVGMTRGKSAVQWNVFRTIIVGWLITIPLAILVSWVIGYAFRLLAPGI
ncbi:MAG: inorganic phosphate transporter [Methanomicrobiales archaeon]|nr:inorganic phosphate transporter [Methanomicrobiales archaeon]